MVECPSTKVYYYLDDNTPYLSKISVAEDAITLGDFKKVFNKKGFKYFCKQLDKTIGCEVKVELHDDGEKLVKSANGLIELVLLPAAENAYAYGTLPKASQKKLNEQHCVLENFKKAGFNLRKRRSLHDLANERLENCGRKDTSNENSVTASSLSTVISKRAGEGLADLYTSNSEEQYHFRDLRFLKLSRASSSDIPISPTAISNGLTPKVRRQRRPRRERYRKAYVPSTISSMTESSMASLSLPQIEVITLPMKNGTFLGISVLSHDGGIFISDIHSGGAVDLDGRIEVGDQIVQVNRNSFENSTDVQAVDLLRKAAASRKPITLYIARRVFEDKSSNFFSGIASETMPIDISLWVESTKQNVPKIKKTPELENITVLDGDVTLVAENNETDMEEAYAERRNGIPVENPNILMRAKVLGNIEPNFSMNSEDVARRRENEENEQLLEHLNIGMDPVIILKHMALPDSGLQIKNRKWLKISVPMSFIGRDLVDWLLEHVHGFPDRKAARAYASNLLTDGHIRHVVNKLTFTEKCYYVFDDEILLVRNKNKSDSSLGKAGAEATTEVTYVGSPAPQRISRFNNSWAANSSRNTEERIWPLKNTAIAKSVCGSSTTNEYASVVNPEMVDSVTEMPTLKLTNRGFPDNLDLAPRLDDSQVSQPPNTPNSLLHEQRTVSSDTDFGLIEGGKHHMIAKVP